MKLRLLAVLLALPLALACTESGKPAAGTTEKAAAPAAPAAARPDAAGRIEVRATKQGYEPSRIEVEAGKPLTLVFLREIEKTCMTGVVFPDLGIEKDLPVGVPVEIELTPEAGGTIAFQCPMGMGKSTIVTLPQS